MENEKDVSRRDEMPPEAALTEDKVISDENTPGEETTEIRETSEAEREVPENEADTPAEAEETPDESSDEYSGKDTADEEPEESAALQDTTEEDSNATRRIDPAKLAAMHAEQHLEDYEEEYEDEEEEQEERDYHPIRFSRRSRLGCLGGMMYAVFIICISVVLACAGWMAACDVLALNKEEFTSTIVLSEDIFSEKEIDVKDDDGKVTGSKTIEVADIDKVARLLKDNGIIEYPWLFKIFAQLSDADRKLDPGTYELSTRYDYRALVKNLQASTALKETKTLTFPEGYTMAQIFEMLEEEGICPADELYKAAAEYEFDFSFLEDAPTGDPLRLEGFIFPNTYDFYVGEQPSAVISKFLNALHNRLDHDNLWQKCDNLGLSFREVVTVASMIEKEAANDDERGLIASVIYNRKRAGMTLGIDATILYVHPEYEGGVNIPDEILSEDSPYNTHLYRGLPPTPICNPGIASIEAALNPEKSYYYYYALDAETKVHQFFGSYEQFRAFVAKQNYDENT